MALSRQSALRQALIAPMLGLILLSSAANAQAPVQPRGPQMFGARDFEMDWRMEPGNRAIRLRYQAELRRLRIEALDGSAQTMLKDLEKGDVLILVDEGRRGVFAAQGQPAPRSFGAPSGRIRTIAGEQCQDFEMSGAVLCLSNDGIPLGVTQGEQQINAERLVRQTQNPALFAPPKDAKPKPIPGRNNTGPLPF
jgi:hypothetical protein